MNYEFPNELRRFINAHEKEQILRVNPAESAHEILYKSGLPYLPIENITVPHEAMFKEAQALEHLAVAHRGQYESHRGWKSLVLHGLGATHTQGAEKYGQDPDDDSIYHWTEIAALCPITTEFLRNHMHYDIFHRVRFMYLEPGGFIAPHTDTDKYYLGPVNIALNQPRDCRFIMENAGVVPFVPGRMIKLALCNHHIVINESDELRIHMILHGSPNFRFWEKIYLESYRRLCRGLTADGVLENL